MTTTCHTTTTSSEEVLSLTLTRVYQLKYLGYLKLIGSGYNWCHWSPIRWDPCGALNLDVQDVYANGCTVNGTVQFELWLLRFTYGAPAADLLNANTATEYFLSKAWYTYKHCLDLKLESSVRPIEPLQLRCWHDYLIWNSYRFFQSAQNPREIQIVWKKIFLRYQVRS